MAVSNSSIQKGTVGGESPEAYRVLPEKLSILIVKDFFVKQLLMRSGEWCDTFNGERCVAVLRANAAPSPGGHENLRIRAER